MPVIFVRKAQALPGQEFAAVKWGMEIAKMASNVIGLDVMFGQQVGGPIGQIGWRVTFADMAAYEAAMMKANSDEAYLKSIADNAGKLFRPDSGHDELWHTL